jgi:sugar phosphate isomerase/epimerase
MRENCKDYFKMGIVHFMAFPDTIKGEGPILETIQKIAEDDFFEAIEITWIKNDQAREKVKELLSSSNLEVCYGAQPPLLIEKLNLNSESEEETRRAIDMVKKCIDEANFLGIKKFGLLSGQDPGEEKRETAMKILTSSLKEICEYARGKGISVSLEVFDRDIDKKCLIGSAEDGRKVALEVRKEYSNFGILYDLSHLPLLRENALKALKTLGETLTHIHIGNCVLKKDSPYYGDQHPPFAVPEGENGVEELREFLSALFEVKYLKKNPKVKPIISFEVKPLPGQTPEEVIAQSKKVLEEAWKLL